MIVSLAVLALASSVLATTYFSDDFEHGSKWVGSKSKEAEGAQGHWEITDKSTIPSTGKALKTTTDYRFYQISAKFDKPFNNKGKDLVVQYSVKTETKQECGGSYVKLLADLDQESFSGDSQYQVMFGPDVCGYSTKKVHLIVKRDGKEHPIKETVTPVDDTLSHLYTLHIKSDNTFSVLVDGSEKASGSLNDFMLPPKEIADPDDKKPSDWVDNEYMDDPDDVKPANWDDIPEFISDPDAQEAPEDWDEELDGAYEPPQIPNPEYKGQWAPKRIKNPAYKGVWAARRIANPAYKEDASLYVFDKPINFIGIENWQVKGGTYFDNFLVTDSIEEAATARETLLTAFETEKKAKEEHDEAERKAAEAKREAEAAAGDADEDSDEWDGDKDEL